MSAHCTYDPVYPRGATMADGIGTTQCGYHAVIAPPVLGAGRLATIDGPWARRYDQLPVDVRDTVAGTTLRDQAYSYDAAGNRRSVQDGNTVKTETANGLNQVTGVTGGGPMRFAGTLDRPAKVTVGGNPALVASDNSFEGFASVSAATTTRAHIVATDIDNHVTDKYVDVTPDLVASQAFTYDANGNTVTGGPTGAPNVAYGRDAADRLVSVPKFG